MEKLLVTIYLLSVLAWGGIMINLYQDLVFAKKNDKQIPSLLLPFIIASFSLFIESVIFGVVAIEKFLLGKSLDKMVMLSPDYWIIPKLLIALSGLFVYSKVRKSKNFFDIEK